KNRFSGCSRWLPTIWSVWQRAKPSSSTGNHDFSNEQRRSRQMTPDSKERYGTVSKWFHWLMGGLIIWQFLKLGDRISEGEHWIGQTLVPWHVSIGALLLVLIVLRIFWAS